jgi:putative transposase
MWASLASLVTMVLSLLGAGDHHEEPRATAGFRHFAEQGGPTRQHLLTDVGASERTQALERFHILLPYLENGVPLAHVSRDRQLQLRTLQRWVRAYRQQGLLGLVRTSRADRGARRSVSVELQQLIEAFALRRPPLSSAAVHREICAIARARGWHEPSYATVYSVIHALPADLVSLAHDGPKVYADRFELLYRREANRPNEMWQADHTPLDLWVLDERSRPARPWLTTVLDDYSRAVAGYALSLHAPSSIQTALALRQAIWRKGEPHWSVCGIPDTFYNDHGSDFTSHHLEQVAADLHMAVVFSTAGKPRGRGKIERFFATVNQLFLSHQPGYTPPGSAPSKPVLTLPELDARLHHFLVETYQQRVHSETNQPPQARWEAGAFLPRLPESLEQLDLLLLTVAKARRVHQDGIHFLGFRYLDTTLAAYVGEDVVIRYDPRDLAELRVYYGESFLCRAINPELAGETVALKDIIRARNQRRRELRATLSERQASIEALLSLRRGGEQEVLLPESEPEQQTSGLLTGRPRLKRYYNE